VTEVLPMREGAEGGVGVEQRKREEKSSVMVLIRQSKVLVMHEQIQFPHDTSFERRSLADGVAGQESGMRSTPDMEHLLEFLWRDYTSCKKRWQR
jgi:hypothetical protein